MAVTAGMERLTFDGLELNDDTLLGLASLDAPAPKQRADWVGSADSEHQALFRDPLYDNRVVTCRVVVAPQASMDAALDQIALVRDKLAEASKTDDGLGLVWRPANSSRSVTFDVLAGEITDMPIDWENGWLAQTPTITIALTAKPYWRGVEFASVTDPFSSNTIADYTVDAGAAGNVSITGGVMDAAANLTTEDRFLHTASPYAVTDSQVTVKHTLGTTLTSYKAGVIVKRVDASNYLEVYVDDNGTNSRLRIDQVVATVRTNLVSTNLTRMTVSTAYWVRGRINGNVVVAEHWTAAPTTTTSAATTNTATLTGGGATALGLGVQGRAGLVWIPQQTAAALDDFEIAPHVTYSGTEPVTTLELANVPGDTPGTIRIIVSNRSSTDPIRWVEWGMEQRSYTPAAPVSLVVDSDSMVTSGFAGTQTTQTGAYDPGAVGNNVIRATLTTSPTAVCGTGTLNHVGRFKVVARVFASSDKVRVRLASRAGESGYLANAWVAPPVTGAFARVDLGIIDIPIATVGTQTWDGRIEAYATDTSLPTIDVDFVDPMPAAEGYGISHAQASGSSGALIARDDFTATTAGGTLNTRVAPAGGTWTTSGDATDFAFADDLSGEQLKRSTVSETNGRFAILGTTASTDVQVQADAYIANFGNPVDQAVIARWTDSSNYLRAGLKRDLAVGGSGKQIEIRQIVAGVETVVASFVPAAFTSSTLWFTFLLKVFSSGLASLDVLDSSGIVLFSVQGTSSALATGGTLASGKSGIFDRESSTNPFPNRYYDNIFVSSLPAELPAVYASRKLELRSDDTLREASAGTTLGREQSYRGARPLAPAKGTDNLTARIAVTANKNDLSASAWETVTPSYIVQGIYTPRGLAVPRT